MSKDSALTDLEKRYETGLFILEQFMKLSDKDLKAMLKTMIGHHITKSYADLLFGGVAEVKRVIVNEKSDEITISYYDQIRIGVFGISYKHEGSEYKPLIEFNENFKL